MDGNNSFDVVEFRFAIILFVLCNNRGYNNTARYMKIMFALISIPVYAVLPGSLMWQPCAPGTINVTIEMHWLPIN